MFVAVLAAGYLDLAFTVVLCGMLVALCGLLLAAAVA
jgi:hypothetical protein